MKVFPEIIAENAGEMRAKEDRRRRIVEALEGEGRKDDDDVANETMT